MSFVWVLITLLLVVDLLVSRKRLAGLAVAPPSDEPVSGDHLFWLAPGVELSDAQRRAASACLRERGLGVLDLVPQRMPTSWALLLLRLYDPATYRNHPFTRGCSALQGVLLTEGVALRSQASPDAVASPAAFAALALRLKSFASTSMDLAVLPGMEGNQGPEPPRPEDHEPFLRGAETSILFVSLGSLFAIALGPFVSPLWGGIAFLLYHLQPFLLFREGVLTIPDLHAHCLLRLPRELRQVFCLLLYVGRRPAEKTAPGDRAWYQTRLGQGLSSFFEPRQIDCPICQGKQMRVFLRSPDMLQHKPGEFTLEQCVRCGHIFQNPRLNQEGLEFYYRDFYDGQGSAGAEFLFGALKACYRKRAELLNGIHIPRRWLDVGTGHAHFCAVARQVWTDTRFDGLDMADSVEDAVLRGWLEQGYRGMLSEFTEKLAGQYDVLSMHHYLEHTRDPREEIGHALRILGDGGFLAIELPNPECPLGRWLGRYWLPWFQPQHQHFLDRTNLERLLLEAGFEPLLWQFGEAHERTDFFTSSYLIIKRLFPEGGMPWQTGQTRAFGLWEALRWVVSVPLYVVATLADVALTGYLRGGRRSNALRVLSRKAGGRQASIAADLSRDAGGCHEAVSES